MSTTFNRIVTLGIIVAMIALTAMLLTEKTFGSAPAGLPTSVASTTSQAVSTTARLLVATSTCDARIITSRAQPLMLTFSDYNGATPTAQFGHLQAASTTVTYDSGVYGCGAVKVYAYGTDSITVTETR